ncbi:Hypothetical predicted protein [Mytilus galloprovincialis]|uniref:B box-type domain-containing protein n=1 Tax=Mytilus galloprovincialis TaxID=29158 RepID=A0A8B6CBU0_MYTGA|nr:Hypothetical predicted protein [Mytilus galloprovincialis]
MASTFHEQRCSICELQHITYRAEEWCPECDEYLCSSCKTHHKLAKASRRHKTVEILDLKELPSFVSAIKLECDTHHENYEYFCPKHEIPICVICAKEHTSCGTFTILRRLEGMKTSPSMVKLEQNVKNIQQHIEIFLQNRRSNLSNLKGQHESCRQKVREIRLEMDQHLDKLEKIVNDEIDTSYTKQKQQVEKTVDNLSGCETKMNTIQKNIEKIKDHASEIQIFLSIQGIQKDVKEEESQLSIICKEELNERELSFHPAPSSKSGIVLKSFGELKTNIKPADISFVGKEYFEAQLVMPGANKKSIDKIVITKNLEYALPTKLGVVKVAGCCNIEKELFLLADQGKKLRIIVVKPNGIVVCEIPLKQPPNNVVYVNKTIFVSSYPSSTLTSIDFETRKVKKTIQFDFKCEALAVAGDKILLHFIDKEYTLYDLNLVEVAKIPIRITNAPFLSYFNEKIYIAQWKANIVYCYSMTGEMIWEYQHADIRGPEGITIDNNGNVFVGGFYSNNISIISPNGENSRNLLNLTEVLSHPTALHYNQDFNQLIVSSSGNNKILVYDVS